MPEGITLKRIIDMDEAAELTSSDYALVDSATGGPKKFALGNELSSLKEDIAGLSGVPTNVRQAIYTLLDKAVYTETGLTDEIAIVESWASEVTSIELNTTSITFSGEGTYQLIATTVPSGVTVSWTSSNPSVATVSDGGLVTSVGNGTATITVSAGELSASCSVEVEGFVILASISAVYTQSGWVYNTDSLDSLKPDLVVTAHYEDSTSETVTTYTLSGTLTIGTSTITVSYGGKTDTFTVLVDNGAYTNYDYAKALTHNNANSIIDTGIVFTPSASVYDIDFKFKITNAFSSGSAILGSRNTSSTTGNNAACTFLVTSTVVAYHLLGMDSPQMMSITQGNINTVKWNFTDGGPSVLTVNDNAYTVGTVSESSIVNNTRSLALLGQNANGSYYNSNYSEYVELGEVKFLDQDGNLVYDFIPATRKSDGYNGFYEKVNGVFYGKSSTYVSVGNWT